MKEKAIYLTAVIIAILYIIIGGKHNYRKIDTAGMEGSETIGGVVTEVGGSELYSKEAYLYEGEATNFSAKTKYGVINAVQYADVYDQVDYKTVEKGDRIVLTSFDGENWSFAGYDRSLVLAVSILLFFGCLILFGGFKGVNTILALLLTGGFVFVVFLPAVLSEKNIYKGQE